MEVKIQHAKPKTMNVGRFNIPRTYFIDMNWAVLKEIFKDVIVFEARPSVACDGIEYIAIHPDFQLVEVGQYGLITYTDYRAIMESIERKDGRGYDIVFKRWERVAT